MRSEIAAALQAEQERAKDITAAMRAAVLDLHGQLPAQVVPMLFSSATWLSCRGVRALRFEA